MQWKLMKKEARGVGGAFSCTSSDIFLQQSEDAKIGTILLYCLGSPIFGILTSNSVDSWLCIV